MVTSRFHQVVARKNAGGGGEVCTLYFESVGDHSSSSSGVSIRSQSSTGTGTVCKVRVYWTYQDSMQCKVQLRTSFNGGGSQIGGDSDTVANSPGGASGFVDYPWSSNNPVISGAFYINVVFVSTNNGDGIGFGSDTGQSFYEGASLNADFSMDYELWTLQ